MAVAGKLGHASTVAKGDGASSETFTTIPGFVDISVSGFDVPTVDITHMQSSSREITTGLRNLGTVSGTLVLDSNDTVQAALFTDWTSGSIDNYKVTFTDTGAQAWTISCFVSNCEASATVEDKCTASVTLQATAAPTIA